MSERVSLPIKPLSILHPPKPHVWTELVVPEGLDPPASETEEHSRTFRTARKTDGTTANSVKKEDWD